MASRSTLLPDARSYVIVREFLIQTGIGVALMLALFVIEAQTLSEVSQAAVRVFTFYSVIDCVRALFGREPVWGASLSRWDQAAAYTCFAMVIKLMLEWPN